MPVRTVIVYGGEYGECPLGKFEIDAACGVVDYTADPVEKCFFCNFADTDQEKFNLEKICQCPVDMTWDKYDELRKEYTSTGKNLTKEGFWDFANKNYKP